MDTQQRRRRLLLGGMAGTLGAAAGATARPALAQSGYPTRAITIVNPFAPGSVSDAAARITAELLSEGLGQAVVVENRVGAGGLLAGRAVARAEPDGYTLLLTASSSHSGTALYKSMPFDPVNDFTHIARIGSFPSFIAVNPSLPIHSITELVEYAKKNPGKLSYGHGNNMGQIVGESLKRRTGIDIVRVGYRSNPAAVVDLIAGHIQVMMPDLNTGLSHVKSGKIRPLAVFTKARSAEMPSVPTLHETVMPSFELLPWCGLSAPANLPPSIVQRLSDVLEASMKRPAVRERFLQSGVGPFWGDHNEFKAYVVQQLENWTALIKEADIEPS